MQTALGAAGRSPMETSGMNDSAGFTRHVPGTYSRRLEKELTAKLVEVQQLRDRLQAENAYLKEQADDENRSRSRWRQRSHATCHGAGRTRSSDRRDRVGAG